MILKNIKILLILVGFALPGNFTLHDLPVQEDGRIKPINSYASNQLLKFYGKKVYKDRENDKKINSVEWFYQLLTNPSEEVNRPIFNIVNPEVVTSLGLDRNDAHKYSFTDIVIGFKENQSLINSLKNKTKEEFTLVEKQIVEVYDKVVYFDEIAHSVICLLPIIEVNNSTIREFMEIEGSKVSYSFFMRNIDRFRVLLEDLLNTNEEAWTQVHYDLSKIAINLQSITQYNYAQALKIVPDDGLDEDQKWLSPWEVLNNEFASKNQMNILYNYENLFSQYLEGDMENSNIESGNIIDEIGHLVDEFKPHLLIKETRYNKLDIFLKSIIFYIISFLVVGVGWMYKKELFRMISLYALIVGFIIHAYGLCLRMIIMQRPPVSTLYESILFVGFILVFLSIIFEFIRKDTLGILIATIGGIILHFIGMKYAADGDTLGMLVAVLNSNFWLATHVTTITIGYGVSLVSGLMAHIYLIFSILKPNNKKDLKKIYDNTYGLTLMALFFTMFGTILGGIWADQSWGRFWGWDPKENGALLIVLWHLMMLHLRISGMVRAIGFAYGVSLVNIVVAIAWFGVNLLNVGLHSYGFTDNVAMNLFYFILIEISITSFMYVVAKKNIKIVK